MVCKIPNYIETTNLPKAEKQRLSEIHNAIFATIKISKQFKQNKEHGWVTRKNAEVNARELMRGVNDGVGQTVMRLVTVAAKNRIGFPLKPVVNVLPLAKATPAKTFTPTKEQLENRKALMEGEPFSSRLKATEDRPRFNTVSTLTRIDLTRSAEEQGVSQEEWNEYYELVYGKNKGQLPLFNELGTRNSNDYKIKEKYFSESNQTTDKVILEKIADSKHPLAPLAKKLIPYSSGIKINLVKTKRLGDKYAGWYKPADNEIDIAQYATFRGLGSEPTLIHEILHSATHRFITNNPSTKSVKDLKSLYDFVKQNVTSDLTDQYALKNIDEFIVAIFTDSSFIQYLTTLPAKDFKEYDNLLDEILDKILSLFNLNNAEKSLYHDSYAVAMAVLEDAKSYEKAMTDLENSVLGNETAIKPGVEELFESNPKLADGVYEALGYKKYSQETRNKLALTESLKNIFKDKSTVLFRAGEDSDAFYVDLVKTSDNRYFMFLENQSPVELSEKKFAEEIEFIDGQIATTEEKDKFINNYLEIADLDQIQENPLLTKEEKLEAIKDILKRVTPEQKQEAQIKYSQYLDTIFPDSKVKDIVYHGTPNGKFEKFDVSKSGKTTYQPTKGIYFTDSKRTADYYAEGSVDFSQFDSLEEYEAVKTARVISALINAKNLKLVDNPQAQEKQGDAILRTENKIDDVGFTGEPDFAHQYIVFEPEQIHILGSQKDIEGFEEFVTVSPLLQLEGVDQTVASDETINKVKELLKRLNIPVKTVDRISKEFSINGMANAFERIIELSYGKENVALTEEAMHMITMMVPSEILKPLMDSITDYEIFLETYHLYANHPSYQNEDGSPNMELIKLEAVGKLLAEYYIAGAEGLSLSQVNAAKTVWASIVDWFKRVFNVHTDYFLDFIDQINSGTLDIGEDFQRQERLYSIAFTSSESEDYTDYLTTGIDPALVGDKNAMRANKNLKTVSELIDLVSSIRVDDLPSVKPLVDMINLPSKKAFEFNRIRLNNVKDATEFRDKILNSLEYIRNTYYTTELLSVRSNDIRKILQTDIDENGDPLESRKRMFLFNELSRINDILEMYQQQSTELDILFNDLDENGVNIRNVALETSKIASSALSNNKALTRGNTVKILDKAVETKKENYKRIVNAEIIKLSEQLKSLTNPAAIKRVEKKIESLQNSLLDIPFSGENLVSLLESVNAADDFSTVALMMEGGMTHKDPVVQAVSNLLSDTVQDSMREAAADVSNLMQIFATFGKSQNLMNNEYARFTEIVERKEFDPKTGELNTYDDYRFIGETAQWKFEDDLEVLDWLMFHAENGRDMTEKYKQHFGEELSNPEQIEAYKAKAKELKENFAERKFIDKYYEIRSTIEDTMLSDGITSVKDARQVVIDQLQSVDSIIDSAADPITLDLALNEKKVILLKLARLESEYDLETGQMKTGDDLLIAKTIAAWKKAKKNVELPGKDPVNVDTYYITNNAKIHWEEEKAKVDDELETAQKMFDARPSAVNRKNLEAKTAIRDMWYRENVVLETPKEFYEERADILTAIQILLADYKTELEDSDINGDVFSTAYEEIFSMTKGLRDEDGTIDGTLAFALSNQIREREQMLHDLKAELKKSSKKFSKADYFTLLELLTMLDEIQENNLTDYFNQTVEAITGSIMANDPDISSEKLLEEFSKTPFFENNMVDVTSRYKRSKGKLPDTVFKIGKKYYLPIYTWREVVPIGQYAKQPAPSMKWKTYKVNEAFDNPKYQTIQGKIALNKDKVAGTKYESKRIDELSPSDKQFLQQVKEFYYKDQLTKKVSARLGDSMPRIAATGIHRKLQVLNPSNWRFKRKKWFKKTMDFIGVTETEVEELYGGGKPDTRIKKNIVTIANKYLNKDLPIRSQERDLFRLLSMYNIESHRVNKLKELIPSLNALLSISEDSDKNRNAGKSSKIFKIFKSPTDTNRTKSLKYEIQKRVNKRTRSSNTQFSRVLNSITDNAQAGLAKTRLAMPWLISSTFKNSAVGAYQLWVQKSGFKQYSKSSFVRAYGTAITRAFEVTALKFAKTPSKYAALVRRLNVTANYDVNDATTLNKDVLLQLANSLGYVAGSFRAMSETQLELTLFEMFRNGNKINGKDLLDLYDYENGVLTPKKLVPKDVDLAFRQFIENSTGENLLKYFKFANNQFVYISSIPDDVRDLIASYRDNNKVGGKDIFELYHVVDGQLEARPEITPEKEREITNSVKNLQQFTQGNFSADNSVYAKQYWLGRILLFMKGFVYNPLMTRIGNKRILSTGQEVQGYYLTIGAMLKSDWKQLFSNGSTWTTVEKDGVRKMLKDLIALNAAGAGMYYIAKALKESGDDDEDETLKWYLLMMYRKVYAEAAVFNPVEKVGVPYRTFFDEDMEGNSREKNPIEAFAEYSIGRPAKELAMSAFLPYDVKGARWSNEDVKTNDPYYSQYSDNWMLYNFNKALKTKPDMFYPKSTMSAFEHFDKSFYQYVKPGENSTGKKRRKY